MIWKSKYIIRLKYQTALENLGNDDYDDDNDDDVHNNRA
jgi:hypothetical protein